MRSNDGLGLLLTVGLAGVAGWTGYEKGKGDGRAEIIPQRDAETRRANAAESARDFERQARVQSDQRADREKARADAMERRIRELEAELAKKIEQPVEP